MHQVGSTHPQYHGSTSPIHIPARVLDRIAYSFSTCLKAQLFLALDLLVMSLRETLQVERKAILTWQQQRCGYNRLPFT